VRERVPYKTESLGTFVVVRSLTSTGRLTG
jgi:hypothetical protein